jgi:N-acetylneuraminic acid mutarotase
MSFHTSTVAGFTLLPVVLTMSLIAAIAFLLNRDNGNNAEMVAGQMDADRARYAAEAGLQAANAVVQGDSCLGGFPVSGTPVTNSNFGGASYSAYATAASGNTTGLVSTGTYNGTSLTLTRSNVVVYQSTPKTYTQQPNGSAGIDTYIQSGSATNFGASSALNINSNSDYPLLQFDLSIFPAGSRPLTATLSLYSGGFFAWGAGNLYRMTSSWQEGTGASSPVDGANWTTSNGTNPWLTPGGDHHPAMVDSVWMNAGYWSAFDLTDLAVAWLSSRYPNQGVMLDMSAGFGTLYIVSSNSSDSIHRPKLSLSYLVPCGATGPSDPVGATVTLSPTADSFDDSGAVQANNGAASALKAYYTAARESRVLMRFDTSSILAGSSVTSANLRMYVSAVASATANSKSIWANAVSDTWAEGAGNNTNKSCPATTTGVSWNYSNNCTAWSYIHPANTAQSWTAMASMPTARTGHVVAMVNNKLYAIGGQLINGTALNAVEVYDLSTNSWATKAALPTARANAAAAVVNGKIYVIGGNTSSGTSLKTTEEYDPATNTWTTKTQMPTARTFVAAAAVSNKIYVLGGATSVAALKTNEEYDPATNSWTSKTQMATARLFASAQAVNGKVYVLGGWSGSASLTSNAAYDPSANSWTNKAALPVGTDSMSSAVLGNRIYLMGGLTGPSTTNAVRAYDTLNDSYVSLLNYPLSADLASAVAYNGRIYAVGGDNNSTTVYTNHYKYDPGIPTPVATAADELSGVSPLAASFSSGWIDFDVTALVQEWVDGVRPNNGVVIYAEVADQFSINSREANSKTPQLIVSY